MLEVYQRAAAADATQIHDTLELDHLQREKGRFKAVSRHGEEVRVFLPRGQLLVAGDLLCTDCGKYLRVVNATEEVLYASAGNWRDFSRACYHLGNRHTRVEVGERWLRILRDHVLQELLEDLGLATRLENAAFVPEPGAYSIRGDHGHRH